MDFDSESKILYTGDEMGNMYQWDVSNLIEKLSKFDQEIIDKKKTGLDVAEFKKTLNQFEKMDNLDLPYDSHEERKAEVYEEEKSETFLTTPKVGPDGENSTPKIASESMGIFEMKNK